LPGPGERGFRTKIMRHDSSHWTGRATSSFSHEPGDSDVGTPGVVLGGPAAFCGETVGPSIGCLFPPMLFARNPLSPGPQAKFSAEIREAIVKVSKPKREEWGMAGGKRGLYFESEEAEDSVFSSAGMMMPAALSRSSRRASFIFFLSLSAKPSKIFQWDFMAFVLSRFRMACRKV
jgi:hypothetical protein